MTAQFTLSAGITDAEAFTLTRLGHHEQWYGHITIERRSEREYDVSIDGGHNKFGFPVGFRGWLPLAMLHLWWGDKQCSHLVDDMGTGDFSFVRDREPDEIWAMFDACRAADGYEHDSPNCSLPGCGYNEPSGYLDHAGFWFAMLLFEAELEVGLDEMPEYAALVSTAEYDAYYEYWDTYVMLNPAHWHGVEK